MPNLICVQCVHQVNSAYSFKQLCEQSDQCLRQYLGKPITQKGCKTELDNNTQSDLYNSNFLEVDSFAMDDESDEDSDDNIEIEKAEIDLLTPVDSQQESLDEKTIAQRQLIKSTKLQKPKLVLKKNKIVNIKNMKSGNNNKKIKRNINQCNVCKKQFVNLKSFRKHLRTHIEDRPYKCKLCPRGFTEENYLNNHMRTHIPDEQKPHECKICKRRFIHLTLLQKHLLKHSEEKPFVCKVRKHSRKCAVKRIGLILIVF